MSDEQYYKQLEFTPRMRYDQDMYHGVTWLEALIRFEIKERLKRRFGSKKAAHPSKHRQWFILEIPKQMEDNKDVTKNR